MKEIPDYEKYPASDEEMCKRYKNWTNTLAAQMVVMYRVGKEFGGDQFVEKMKEEFFKSVREHHRCDYPQPEPDRMALSTV